MLRIGHGYDVHRLVEGRKLILGGVEIENIGEFFSLDEASKRAIMLFHAWDEVSVLHTDSSFGQLEAAVRMNNWHKVAVFTGRNKSFCAAMAAWRQLSPTVSCSAAPPKAVSARP